MTKQEFIIKKQIEKLGYALAKADTGKKPGDILLGKECAHDFNHNVFVIGLAQEGDQEKGLELMKEYGFYLDFMPIEPGKSMYRIGMD